MKELALSGYLGEDAASFFGEGRVRKQQTSVHLPADFFEEAEVNAESLGWRLGTYVDEFCKWAFLRLDNEKRPHLPPPAAGVELRQLSIQLSPETVREAKKWNKIAAWRGSTTVIRALLEKYHQEFVKKVVRVRGPMRS